MSTDRRMIAQSRRRRVLYQTSLEDGPETAAERRAAERLREARRPTAHYGSHVRRRLRGRWFSLVPVSRMAMTGYTVAILVLTAMLCLMHYLAVSWEPLALRDDIARPFRLDRVDSFGTYIRAIFLLGAAGTSLLVYQLRRYKVDDYKGHYRLWRPVIVLLVLMSIDTACGLVPWAGSVVDAAIGKRVAMPGANWLRIAMAVGGIVLAVRLLVEVHRSRLSLMLMSVAVACWCAPLLGYWNLYELNTFRGWMTTTTTPLIAAATFWAATGAYLRMLFRDVRGLDVAAEQAADAPMAKSKRNATAVIDVDDETENRGWFSWLRRSGRNAEEPVAAPEKRRGRMAVVRRDEDAAGDDNESAKSGSQPRDDKAPKRRWLGLRGAGKAADSALSSARAASDQDSSRKPLSDSDVTKVNKPKRSWFGRKAKSSDADTKHEARSGQDGTVKPKAASSPASEADESQKPRRSWLGFVKKSKTSTEEATAKQTKQSNSAAPAKDTTAAEPVKKSGLGAWLSRGKSGADADSTAAGSNRGPSSAGSGKPSNSTSGGRPSGTIPGKTAPQAGASSVDDMDDYDEDDGENSSMSKADRRRLRKEARRNGRAA